MIERLIKYHEELYHLMEDIEENKLTYDEAIERRKKNCEFIPDNYEVYERGLDDLMEEKYKNWGKDKIFTIFEEKMENSSE